MQFQDRVRIITAKLNDFLRRYKRPDHLDQSEALNELREMAEELNGLMPASFSPEDLAARIDAALRHIRQTYKGRAWPTVSHMVDAMDRVAKLSGAPAIQGADAPKWAMDSMATAARRMNAGEPVGDEWLYGRNAVRLTRSGLVPSDTMRQYRSALYFAAKDATGHDIAVRMEESWRKRHAEAERLDA